VLLLDEPLGALDARLRKDLQVELKALQADIGVTFVFVTHDQEEALTMSDRVAVMRDGSIEQAGTPREVYEEPRTTFVADFLGVSNIFHAESTSNDGDGCRLQIGDRTLRAVSGDTRTSGAVRAMIRPERIGLEPQGMDGENRVPGMVERSVFRGGYSEVHVRIVGGDLLKVSMLSAGDAPTAEVRQGTPVTLHLPADALRVLGPERDASREAPVPGPAQ